MPESWRHYYSLGLLLVTMGSLYADQNVMAPNLSAIAADLGFDAAERDWKLGGEISVAFFVLGAPAALLIGFLADHVNRYVLFVPLTRIIGQKTRRERREKRFLGLLVEVQSISVVICCHWASGRIALAISTSCGVRDVRIV